MMQRSLLWATALVCLLGSAIGPQTAHAFRPHSTPWHVPSATALAVDPHFNAPLLVAQSDDLYDDASDDSDLWGDEEGDLWDEDDSGLRILDPIQPVNRVIFWFNNKFYFWLLKPTVRVYRVIPEPVRMSVGRFFYNLYSPTHVVNSVLQLKFKDAGSSLTRLVVNSTIGIGGLFDPAEAWLHLSPKPEDFGQTLGHYGVGAGPYVVLPVLGATNLRDMIGRVPDIFLDPLSYLPTLEGLGARSASEVNWTSLDRDTYDGIVRDAIDPYLFIRDAYTQRRIGKIAE